MAEMSTSSQLTYRNIQETAPSNHNYSGATSTQMEISPENTPGSPDEWHSTAFSSAKSPRRFQYSLGMDPSSDDEPFPKRPRIEEVWYKPASEGQHDIPQPYPHREKTAWLQPGGAFHNDLTELYDDPEKVHEVFTLSEYILIQQTKAPGGYHDKSHVIPLETKERIKDGKVLRFGNILVEQQAESVT